LKLEDDGRAGPLAWVPADGCATDVLLGKLKKDLDRRCRLERDNLDCAAEQQSRQQLRLSRAAATVL
jgi:hypothetical protein